MTKVTVLGLSGCRHCEALVRELHDSDIRFELVDANKNGAFADKVEGFLGVDDYPIVIISESKVSYYLYRGSTYESLTEEKIGQRVKIGCATTSVIADHVKTLISN
jgi:glutaredoxin